MDHRFFRDEQPELRAQKDFANMFMCMVQEHNPQIGQLQSRQLRDFAFTWAKSNITSFNHFPKQNFMYWVDDGKRVPYVVHINGQEFLTCH